MFFFFDNLCVMERVLYSSFSLHVRERDKALLRATLAGAV